MNDKESNIHKDEIPIPIIWNAADENLPTPFATNMVIQIIESVFKLSFFEVKPPIILDTAIPPPTSIKADRVASVLVSADKIPEIIKIMQGQLDQYNSRKQTG